MVQAQVPAEAATESQYGSPEADAAVQKLQSMGATVYPPGNKDAIDWGALAGGVQQGPGTPLCTAVRHLFLASKELAQLSGICCWQTRTLQPWWVMHCLHLSMAKPQQL